MTRGVLPNRRNCRRHQRITAADRLCLIAMLIGASVALWACTTPNSEPFDAPIAWGRP